MRVLTSNPYNKTHWTNRIRDPITGVVVVEGVPFTARPANNIEDGIYNAYMHIIDLQNELIRTQIQMAAIGRAPGNTGAITDTMDGNAINLIRQTAIADVIRPISAGTVYIPLDSVEGFEVGTEITILDSEKYEKRIINAIDATDKTILVHVLENNYVKGAKVAESTLFMDVTTKTLKRGAWGTFTVSVSGVS